MSKSIKRNETFCTSAKRGVCKPLTINTNKKAEYLKQNKKYTSCLPVKNLKKIKEEDESDSDSDDDSDSDLDSNSDDDSDSDSDDYSDDDSDSDSCDDSDCE